MLSIRVRRTGDASLFPVGTLANVFQDASVPTASAQSHDDKTLARSYPWLETQMKLSRELQRLHGSRYFCTGSLGSLILMQRHRSFGKSSRQTLDVLTFLPMREFISSTRPKAARLTGINLQVVGGGSWYLPALLCHLAVRNPDNPYSRI